jgi:hypothetical protein
VKPEVRYRSLALALLLVACNLVFASHVSAHLNPNPAGCEWCVCQGQTPAVPLAAQQAVPVVAVQRSEPETPVLLPATCWRSKGYRSRAPPVFA